MKKATLLSLCATAGILSAAAQNAVNVALDVNKPTFDVKDTMYGIFFEDINHAIDGGIYPELLENRGFDWLTKDLEGWTPDYRDGGMARISIQYGNPVHPNTARHLRIESYGKLAGVKNAGYDGVSGEAGKSYTLSFYARGLNGYKGNIRFLWEGENGEKLAEYVLPASKLNVGGMKGPDFELPAWKRFSATLSPAKTVKKGTFSVLLDEAGAVELEMVSLYPVDTFNGRKNGLRKDLVQLLKDIKPGVMRFPGGCIAEGHDFQHWYDWKRTVGTLERRETIWNTWGYWQTMGLGYYEYFCLAEDIGAEPLPICLSGMTCQFRGVKYAPMESMDYFVKNICDLIEFANGDAETTEWGKLRAEMGHPKPFNLKYVGIGNENWGQDFLDRYDVIARKVRQLHPEIKIIGSAGAGRGDNTFDEKTGDFGLAWRFVSNENADLIDEHFYAPPSYFLEVAQEDTPKSYDKYDRKKPHVFAGEYACHLPYGPKNNLESALYEAAGMTGFERNCDIVDMATYAPLFQKVGWNGWKPDLIWFDNLESFGTPNYYVQKMFGNNRPSKLLPSTHDAAKVVVAPKGQVGFQTWNTAAEFTDVKVVAADGKVLFEGTPDLAGAKGRWTVEGGVLKQGDARSTDTTLFFGDKDWGDYTVSFKVRRTAGEEGFILHTLSADGRNVRFNIGGWGNREAGYEFAGYSENPPAHVPCTLEDNRWYDVTATVKGGTLSLAMDGKTVLKPFTLKENRVPDFFQVCGLDEKTNEVIVKLVNLGAEKKTVTVDFGAALPKGEVTRETLAGNLLDENDLANPTRCATVTDKLTFAGGKSLTVEIPATSFTVLRVKK